ncbi:MAG: hypothetical protein NTY80_01730 [candidate division SR1 bacterium]|nr:hypothetical protein [candidate division SR1 bacterium]
MSFKRTGKYLLLASGLWLSAKLTLDNFNDSKEKHSIELFLALRNKETESVRFKRLEEENKDKKALNDYLRRMRDIDGLKNIAYDQEKEIADLEKQKSNLEKQKSDLEYRLQMGTSYSYTETVGDKSPWGATTYEHEDETTTQILKALSGFDTKILYPDTSKEITGDEDSLMYKTVRAMHTKYMNPKIALVKKFNEKNTRATYVAIADSMGLQKNIRSDKALNQKYYIESWLAELAHAYQLERDGLQLFKERTYEDDSLVKAQGKIYDNTYDIPGTIEYEAHHDIEKALKKEFITTYISLCDTNNIDQLQKIFVLNSDFFENYSNRKEAIKYYEEITRTGYRNDMKRITELKNKSTEKQKTSN